MNDQTDPPPPTSSANPAGPASGSGPTGGPAGHGPYGYGPSGGYPVPVVCQQEVPHRRRKWLSRTLTGLLTSVLLVSLLMNLYLGIFFVSVTRGPSESVYVKGDAESENRIVILPISGTIDDETSAFVRRALTALRDNTPRALVIRVESGGGGVSASDQIWHELSRFKQDTKIPVVASFGAMAASGGYYVAMPADHIVAEPTTITGSIGVIAHAFTVHELLEKVGVTPEIIAATEATEKDMLNPARPWTDKDRRKLRLILDQAQTRFVDVVDRGRPGLDRAAVRSLATGEALTASRAIEAKLVDSEGYLDAAIDKAKQLAVMDTGADPMVTVMAPKRGLNLLRTLATDTPPPSAITADRARDWLIELTTPRLEYRWSP